MDLAVLIPLLEDINRLPHTSAQRILACVPVFLLSGTLLFLWFSSFYRDEPISHLTTRVEQGIFTGVYTTPQNASSVVRLEEQLATLQQAGQSVLFLGMAPPAYSMVEMRAATPTVWIVGFNSPVYSEWFPLYYSQGEHFEPDQIYFIDEESYQQFLDNPNLELSKIIKQDYRLKQEIINDDGAYPIRLFIRK